MDAGTARACMRVGGSIMKTVGGRIIGVVTIWRGVSLNMFLGLP